MHQAHTRREILAGVAAAIAAVGTAAFPTALYAEAEVTVDQFLALSEKLTGKAKLDAGLAATLLGGFLATGKGPGIAKLISGDDIDDALSNAIVAAWYSGIYDSGWGQGVATFNDALVWSALTFTKPWANCGGATGYWSDPPAS